MKQYFIKSIFGMLFSISLLTSCKKDVPAFNNNTRAILNKSNNNTFTTNNAGSTSPAASTSSASKGKGPLGIIIISLDTSKAGR